MDSLSVGLQQALIFLIYSSVIMMVFVTVFLIKLLIDLSTLAKTAQDLSVILKHELEPTIKELQTSLEIINTMVSNADQQINTAKNALSSAVGSAAGALSKAKGASTSFLDGILAGVKFFSKLRK